MDAIDVDGAIDAIDGLIEMTKSVEARAALEAVRAVVCALQQANIAAYAVVQQLDGAIDRNIAEGEPIRERLRIATGAPESVRGGLALLEHVAQWCEIVAGEQQRTI